MVDHNSQSCWKWWFDIWRVGITRWWLDSFLVGCINLAKFGIFCKISFIAFTMPCRWAYPMSKMQWVILTNLESLHYLWHCSQSWSSFKLYWCLQRKAHVTIIIEVIYPWLVHFPIRLLVVSPNVQCWYYV